ncbi:MAG: UDP-N-acetylmuramoyl-L-alanine--D-glutamate ligase, partial [Anaerolineales bacterium]
MKNWKGQRVLIIGAARQGLALARFLICQGADVTLNDQNPAEQMKNVIQSMEGYPVHWALGGHPLDLLENKDLVCLSGGIPLALPIIVEAQRRGIPLSNDSQIFMEAVPCRVIGITGSAGKTTTTTLVGRMAQVAVQPPAKLWVGGNIGLPLIDQLDKIAPHDTVVLELSSFQLEQMTISPQVAAILNITPNHLDRHGTFAAYTAAKARILTFQTERDAAVLSCDDPVTWGLAGQVRGRLITFGRQRPPAGQLGTFVENNAIYLSNGGQCFKVIGCNDIQLRGDHNLLNVLAACAIAHAAGFSVSAMIAGIRGFTGVPHRLEYVRTLHGVDWYNDSIATAPERTIAAIRSFQEPLVLLLG